MNRNFNKFAYIFSIGIRRIARMGGKNWMVRNGKAKY